MNDGVLAYALIAATVAGTVIAVLIGRYLDKGTSKRSGVIGIHIPQKSEIIDFTRKNILLVPLGKTEPIERLYEREILVGNVGFDIVNNFQIKICREYVEPSIRNANFTSQNISVNPEGLEFEICDGQKHEVYEETIVKFGFMNRGDSFRLRILSNSEIKISFLAHHPDTIFKDVNNLELLPTLRQKVGNVVGSGRMIEKTGVGLIVTAAAAATAAGFVSEIEKFISR